MLFLNEIVQLLILNAVQMPIVKISLLRNLMSPPRVATPLALFASMLTLRAAYLVSYSICGLWSLQAHLKHSNYFKPRAMLLGK